MKEIFCQRLRELRGFESQAKAAKMLGFSQVNLSQYESGKREPNLEKLARIAKTFSVSVDWLLGLTDERNPRPAPSANATANATAPNATASAIIEAGGPRTQEETVAVAKASLEILRKIVDILPRVGAGNTDDIRAELARVEAIGRRI